MNLLEMENVSQKEKLTGGSGVKCTGLKLTLTGTTKVGLMDALRGGQRAKHAIKHV